MKCMGFLAAAAVLGIASSSLALTPLDKLKFPVTLPEQHDKIGDGHHMATTVVLSENGRLDVKTHIWSKNVKGFHGSVKVYVLDSTDAKTANRLFATDTNTYGVDGDLPGLGNDRTSTWDATVPPEAMAKAKGLLIVHGNDPKPWWESPGKREAVEEAVKLGAKIIAIGG